MEFNEIAEIEEIVQEATSNEKIMLSIWCVTYNHKEYIKEALDGFINQKTDFKYEIVIFDDASTDGTAQIIRDYAEKKPDMLRAYLAKKNTYKYPNRQKLINQYMQKILKGKYVALCEGDDCWIDSHKLQIQVEYLEKYPECVLTVHNAIRLDCRNNNVKPMMMCAEDTDLEADGIIVRKHGFLPTASMVLHRDMLKCGEFFLEAGVGDYSLQLYCLSKGTVHYFSRIMSVYRYMHEGSWQQSQTQDVCKHFWHCIKMIFFLKLFNEYSNREYEKYIVSAIQDFADSILQLCPREGISGYIFDCKIKSNGEYEKYFNCFRAIERLIQQRFNENFCDERIKVFVSKYRHIVVMGTGAYGTILARQLDNNSIPFDGFVVSNNQEITGNYLGKKVWHIKNMPFEKNQVGVLVAINPTIWYQIKEILMDSDLKNYMCPFTLFYIIE